MGTLFSVGEGRLCAGREREESGVISKAGLSHVQSPGQRVQAAGSPGQRAGKPSRPGRGARPCGPREVGPGVWGLMATQLLAGIQSPGIFALLSSRPRDTVPVKRPDVPPPAAPSPPHFKDFGVSEEFEGGRTPPRPSQHHSGPGQNLHPAEGESTRPNTHRGAGDVPITAGAPPPRLCCACVH